MTRSLPASVLEVKEVSHKGFPVLNTLSCIYNVKQLANNEQSRKGKENSAAVKILELIFVWTHAFISFGKHPGVILPGHG